MGKQEVIINRKSIQPIYEQIVEQIKKQVVNGELQSGDSITSVRVLAKELKIGALTVQKAYDILQKEGIIESVVGKGTIVSSKNISAIEIERDLTIENKSKELISLARKYNVSKEELLTLINMLFHEDGE